jgi:hypothetical protein
MKKFDLGYLTGIIDGEGTIFLTRRSFSPMFTTRLLHGTGNTPPPCAKPNSDSRKILPS